METQTTQNIDEDKIIEEIEYQTIELIKCHLYESLEILKKLKLIKKERFVCENCKETFNQKNRRRKEGKEYCYRCYLHLKFGKMILDKPTESPLDISNMKEENIPKLILNHIKQPIIVNQPITDCNMVENNTQNGNQNK